MGIVTKSESNNLADKCDRSQDTILSSLTSQLHCWCTAVCMLRGEKKQHKTLPHSHLLHLYLSGSVAHFCLFMLSREVSIEK